MVLFSELGVQEVDASTKERAAAETERKECREAREEVKRELLCKFILFCIHSLGSTRQRILDWLWPGSFTERLDALREQRIPNTGKWFLETPKFQDWVSEAGGNSLFCFGIRTKFFVTFSHGFSRCWEISFDVHLFF